MTHLKFLFIIGFLVTSQIAFAQNCPLGISDTTFWKNCTSSTKNKGGLFKVICDKGSLKGCCYSKMSGSTTSDFELCQHEAQSSPKPHSQTHQ